MSDTEQAHKLLAAITDIGLPNMDEPVVLTRVVTISEWGHGDSSKSLFQMTASADGHKLSAWESVGLMTTALAQLLNSVQGT